MAIEKEEAIFFNAEKKLFARESVVFVVITWCVCVCVLKQNSKRGERE